MTKWFDGICYTRSSLGDHELKWYLSVVSMTLHLEAVGIRNESWCEAKRVHGVIQKAHSIDHECFLSSSACS